MIRLAVKLPVLGMPAALLALAARPLAAVANGALPAHRFAAPDMVSGSPATGVGGLGEVTLALGVVLAAIFGLAWVVRRVRGVAGAASALGVLAEVRLGPKERALLVKVGSQQLLVGVAPGHVATLHVLPQPIEVVRAGTPAPTDGSDFRALLSRALSSHKTPPRRSGLADAASAGDPSRS